MKPPEQDQQYGGSDKQEWQEYVRPDTTKGSDKGGHRERSEYWQPNHQNHWRKEKQ